MSDIPTEGFIYLLKMFNTNNIIIYKIGKSINFFKRYKKYDYAKILMFISSNDITKDETEIIKLFNKNCKIDKGREYFTTIYDDCFILDLFMDYFHTKNKITSEANKITKNILEEKILAEKLLEEIILDKKILEENIVITKDIINNSIIYNPNCDKSCPNCKIVFKYPSRLKTHFQLTIHCKKTPNEITNYFENITKQKARCLTGTNILTPTPTSIPTQTYTSINNIYKCDKCNSTYTFLHNLNRHKTSSKCSRSNSNNINLIKNKLLTNIENIKIEISKLNDKY